MVEDQNKMNLSRRSAIKGGLSGLLFSATAATTAQAVTKTPVVSEIGGDGTEYTQDVPTRWWEYNLRSRTEMRNARDDLRSANGVVSVGRSFSGEKLQGRPKPVLDVKIEPPAQSEMAPDTVGPSSIPSSFNGVPVRVREDSQSEKVAQKYESSPYLTDDYSKKRAGQAADSDIGGHGTIGSYAYREEDDTIFFITASHIFGKNDGGDKYENLIQGDDEMGFVQYQNESQDWAAVAIWLDKESMVDEPLIQRSGKSSKLVHGHYTEDGVDLITSRNGQIYRQGRSTGYHEGSISNVNQKLLVDDVDHSEAIEYNDMPCATGDSGGPVFADSQASSGSVSMIGIHSVGEPTGENSETAYAVEGGTEYDVTQRGYASPAFFAHREKSIWFGAGGRESTY